MGGWLLGGKGEMCCGEEGFPPRALRVTINELEKQFFLSLNDYVFPVMVLNKYLSETNACVLTRMCNNWIKRLNVVI